MRRVTRNPSVTAGLKCPPEIGPTADTITAITRPFANAMSVERRAHTRRRRRRRRSSAKTPTNSSVRRGGGSRARAWRANDTDPVGRSQPITKAPLFWSIAWPVTPSASSERSHATVPAISLGLAHPAAAALPASRAPTPRPRSALRTVESPSRVMSVSTQPGQIAFTWMRRGASSAANARHEPEQAGLRRAVARCSPATPMRERIDDGDDDPPAVGEERLGGARAPVGAVEVRLHDLVEAVVVARLVRRRRCPRSRRARRAARSNAAKTASRSLMSTTRIVAPVRAGLVAVEQRQSRALGREPLRDREPDPFRRSRNDDVLALETIHAGESTSARAQRRAFSERGDDERRRRDRVDREHDCEHAVRVVRARAPSRRARSPIGEPMHWKTPNDASALRADLARDPERDERVRRRVHERREEPCERHRR